MTTEARALFSQPQGFEARFHGECDDCGEVIRPGQLIEYRGGFTVHVTHGPAEIRPTCSICWQAVAFNGTCGCDE